MIDKKHVYRLKCIESEVNADLYTKIYDFYEEHQHAFNADRDPMALLDSLCNGSSVIIVDPHDEIVAASLTFRYGDRHTEAGGTRVVKNGFGLQRVMKWYQVLNDHLFRKPKGYYFAVVARANKASRANIERCGFTEFTIEDGFLYDLGIVASPEEVKDKAFLAFDKTQLPKISDHLLELDRNPVIRNKKTGEEIVLRIEGKLCRNKGLLSILEKLSKSDDVT